MGVLCFGIINIWNWIESPDQFNKDYWLKFLKSLLIFAFITAADFEKLSVRYLFKILSKCYKSVQSFRVTCLFTGQYDTEEYGTIADVI